MLKQKFLNIQAQIFTDAVEIDNVNCNIHLPNKLTDRIKVDVFLTKEQVDKFGLPWKFSLKGNINNKKIIANNVYSHKLDELKVLKADTTDLKIIEDISQYENYKPEGINGYFLLTPNNILRPHAHQMSGIGGFHIEPTSRYSFVLKNKLTVMFDYFYFSENENNNTTINPELIARFLSEEVIDIENDYINLFDDLLLILSFITRQRTACLGWSYLDKTKKVTYYRRNISIPEERDVDFDEILLIPEKSEEYGQRLFNRLCELDSISKNLIKQAIQYCAFSINETIETEFIFLFATLETIKNFYTKLNPDLEKILQNTQFKKFKKEAMNWLNSYTQIDDNDKELICEKFLELNRPSFGKVFDSLCSYYSIDLHDLWPIADKTVGQSILGIRNRLVHGEYLNENESYAIGTAKYHLRCSIERIILTILGCPISETALSSRSLAHRPFYNQTEWHNDRKILTK